MSKSLLKGHRDRLRERFLSHPESFTEAELLELMLFHVIPRRDTKIIAKTLLLEGGSLINVLANIHNINDLSYINTRTKSLIHLLYQISLHVADYRIKDYEKFQIEDIVRYYRLLLQWKNTEELHILLLNNQDHILHKELLSIGTITSVNTHPRELMKSILKSSATKIILVHNHPSGNPEPSLADLQFTKKLSTILRTVDIKLFDHIIIGHKTYYSFRDNILLI